MMDYSYKNNLFCYFAMNFLLLDILSSKIANSNEDASVKRMKTNLSWVDTNFSISLVSFLQLAYFHSLVLLTVFL